MIDGVVGGGCVCGLGERTVSLCGFRADFFFFSSILQATYQTHACIIDRNQEP